MLVCSLILRYNPPKERGKRRLLYTLQISKDLSKDCLEYGLFLIEADKNVFSDFFNSLFHNIAIFGNELNLTLDVDIVLPLA